MIRAENIVLVRQSVTNGEASILSGISFTARPGQVTAIVGPSGSGKSSLIRLVNRMDDPTSGSIFLHDTPISAIDPLELRRRVAMVLQKTFMFEGSVLANLQRPFVYRQTPPPAADDDHLLTLLDLVHLPGGLLPRDARSLSIGEQQRVNLARALITVPEALLLDEPTSALDRPTADRLGTMLREICQSQQLTVIMVTHDLRLAERSADYLLYLERGRILEEGPVEKLLNNPQTEALQRFLTPDEEASS